MNNNFSKAFIDLVTSRRSTRAFLPDPVPLDTLQTIFQTANYAPSNCNTQPWRSYVVSGETRNRLSRTLKATITEGKLAMDFPEKIKDYQGVYRERQIAVAKLLYGALGIQRGDREGRTAAFVHNLDFFDAPHAVFLFYARMVWSA